MIKPTHETDVVPKCSHVFPGSSAACASDLGAATSGEEPVADTYLRRRQLLRVVHAEVPINGTRAFAAKHPHTSIPLPPNRRWCLEGEDVLPQDEVLFDDGRLFSCMDWPGHRGHKYAAAGTGSYPEGHYVRPVTEAEQPSSLAVDETQQRLERLAASLVDLVQNNNRLHVDEAGHVCGMYSRTSEGIRKDVAAFLAGVERAAERRAKAEQEVKFQALSQVEAVCLREENKHLRHQVEILGRDVSGAHRKMTKQQDTIRKLRELLAAIRQESATEGSGYWQGFRTAWEAISRALSVGSGSHQWLARGASGKEAAVKEIERLYALERHSANDREQARLWGVVVEELRVGFSVENGNAQLSLEDCVRKELRRLYAVEKGRNEDAELLDWVSTREANIRRLDSGRYHVSYRPEWCVAAAAGGATLREALQRAKRQDERCSAKHAVA
jgi:hypothetical protein